MKILGCMILICLIASLICVGCAPTPQEASIIMKLNSLKAGDLVNDEFMKDLGPYLCESTLTYTKYDFKAACDATREWWICIDHDNRIISIYKHT